MLNSVSPEARMQNDRVRNLTLILQHHWDCSRNHKVVLAVLGVQVQLSRSSCPGCSLQMKGVICLLGTDYLYS